MIDAILWDMDGVIVDTEFEKYENWKRAASVIARKTINIDFDYFKKNCAGKPGDIISEILIEHLGLGSSFKAVDLYTEEKKGYIPMYQRENLIPLPSAIDLVNRLHKDGRFIQAIVSSQKSEHIKNVLDAYNLNACFKDNIFSGYDLKNNKTIEPAIRDKPFSDIYLFAAKTIGVEPSSCVGIEDSGSGIKSVVNTKLVGPGMYCIAVPNRLTETHNFSGAHVLVAPYNVREEMKKNAIKEMKETKINKYPENIKVFDNLEKLTADYIINLDKYVNLK
jgi:HAD superfamily hydrolase (TIGR01509 family)